jgi:hypothetical protein
MKKIALLLVLFTTFVSAQEYYWTTYSFSVDAEDEEIVAKLANDYFSSPNSKSDGVSVFLFENHFNDSENNSSHTIAFTGDLDAMGNQYSQGENINWQLFLTKLNRYTKSHSSAAGRSLLSYGVPGSHSIQNILALKVNNASKFASGFKKYNSKFNPKERRVTLGQFNLGRSSDGETHYVLVGVDTFKEAFNMGIYREKNKAAQTAWDSYMEENEDNVSLVRSTTRVMIGKW